MTIKETDIKGLFVLEPEVFRDQRGYFLESFNQSRMETLGFNYRFVQDNQSHSTYGVIRGLHYQREPHEQAKLIRVLRGSIYDVSVDIREDSPTFGKWFGLEISAEHFTQVFIPAGFAHGFSVLTPEATVFYKCDNYYNPSSETGIRFDDPDLGIDWKIDPDKSIVSDKDRMLPLIKDLRNHKT